MKRIFVVSILMMAAMALSAQESRWQAGAYGMAGRTAFTYENASTDRFYKGTYELGVFGRLAMNDRIYWRLGLGFASAHAGYRGREGGIDIPGFPPLEGDPYEIRFKFEYVTVPAEMLIDLNKKPGGFYLLLGPALRIRLYREAEKTAVLAGSGETFRQDFTGGITNRGVELFGAFGAGYTFLLPHRYSLYVQPVLTTNVGGEILATLDGRTRQAGFVTAYSWGVQVGVARGF